MRACRIRSLIASIALVMICSGCHSVTSPYLAGVKPAVLSPDAWNGIWGAECSSQGKDTLEIEVLDREKGMLRAVIQNDKGPPDIVECYLRTAGDLMFVNARMGQDCEHHYWLINNESGKVILLWSPDYEKFKRLVEKGALPGEIKGSDISLGKLTPEQLNLILSDKEGFLFDWKQPVVLIRQTGARPR